MISPRRACRRPPQVLLEEPGRPSLVAGGIVRAHNTGHPPRPQRRRKPRKIGAMVGPEAFTEVRYLSHHKQLRALTLIPQLAAEFEKQFGRDSGGLIRTYRTDDAETIVVALGSVNGTIQEVVDEMRERRLADRLGVDLLVPAVPARRAARGAAAREARRRARKVPGGRPGRHRLRRRAQVAVGHRAQRLHRHRRARRARDHPRVADATVRGCRARRARAGDVPRSERRRDQPRARAREQGAPHRARPPKPSCAGSAPVASSIG